MAETRALVWFRKGLRLHDNPALQIACDRARYVYPVFVLDPWYLEPDPTAASPGSARAGVNRIRFMLESLQDLETSLCSRGSRLLLLHGNPVTVIPQLLTKWRINALCFEHDTEPYSLSRDHAIKELAERSGVEIHCPVSHTIFNPDDLIAKNGGKAPLTFQSFLKLLNKSAAPPPLGNCPVSIPAPGDLCGQEVLPVPTLDDLGYKDLNEEFTPFPGGESEALKRLEDCFKEEKWILEFEKPKGDPTAFIQPATTVLSPYLKFGCLSSRLFHSRVKEVYSKGKSHTNPPVSLEAQLLWREFFYTAGYGTSNFDKMVGNSICKQIPWKNDDGLLSAWRDAQTGYPWIDAAMTQLRKWGWMHHLARHAVACFLTRGDMFVYWEKGRDVFERLLIDSDWSINNGNWLWLSGSAFFNQYHRIYSPITFGKKYDPQGKYVKYFLPVLRDMPEEYVYEPWKAPVDVQKRANCLVGKDYPNPVIDHAVANKVCRERMAAAYALNKQADGNVTKQQLDELQDELRRTVEGESSQPNRNKKRKQSRLTDFMEY